VSALFGMLAGHLISQNIFIWLIIGALVSVVAQFGDLVESIIKRRHGVKNASALVPGHGGVMDRVDGLGMVSVV
ncbi:MAG: phosphatidate cytidylyltransferase, partial [Henriciella sp.]